ncbi:MAG TPA: TolC family protein, partial [Thermoanaerobaculia bacterium]|nr:TolC family protein [Thermoanaerobaculia bacterium]
MSNGRAQGALTLATWLLAAGCASTDPRPAFEGAARLAAERGVSGARVLSDDVTRREAAERVHALLAAPLTADSAAEIALLGNPNLQADLAGLGIAQADLAQAALLANPRLSIVDLHAEGRAPGSQRTVSLEVAILDWLVQPLRKRVAAAELERVRLMAGGAILETAAAARSAFVSYQAAEQLIGRLEIIERLDQAGADFAESLFQAGNLGALPRAQARATWAETHAALEEARAGSRRAREAVNVALGLSGEDDWTAPAELPELPAPGDEADLTAVEALAARQRLDLSAARFAVDAIGRA